MTLYKFYRKAVRCVCVRDREKDTLSTAKRLEVENDFQNYARANKWKNDQDKWNRCVFQA